MPPIHTESNVERSVCRTARKAAHPFTSNIIMQQVIETVATDPTPTLTFQEFTSYFDTAEDRLFTLLEGNADLRRIAYMLKVLGQSNRNLREIQQRQEQYARSQFKFALEQGLEQCIRSLVRKERSK